MVTLPEASNDNLVPIKAALRGVARTSREQGDLPWRCSKAGVVTVDLVPLAISQRVMPGLGQRDRERSAPLMAALDACSARWGRSAVVPAQAGQERKRDWLTKSEMRTPRYTTWVEKLPVARA